MPPYRDKTSAARALGVSVGVIDRLITAGHLAVTANGKPTQAAVDQLAAQHTRTCPTDRPTLRCPVNPDGPTAGGLYYPQGHPMLTTLNQHLAATGRPQLQAVPGSGLEGTGAWEVSPAAANTLEQTNGIILATIGGYVVDAAEVIARGPSIHHRDRKLFLVRPLTGPAADRWYCHRANKRMLPTYLP
ncbi:hypothetical protein [Dietzia sp. 179-F 9C3 NHS]|uniref:hypothetical protein n=1 Tax=Dietzia sp. 179-F 9C3 NHS TaxID=3374295 RepID=UPI00387908B3